LYTVLYFTATEVYAHSPPVPTSQQSTSQRIQFPSC